MILPFAYDASRPVPGTPLIRELVRLAEMADEVALDLVIEYNMKVDERSGQRLVDKAACLSYLCEELSSCVGMAFDIAGTPSTPEDHDLLSTFARQSVKFTREYDAILDIRVRLESLCCELSALGDESTSEASLPYFASMARYDAEMIEADLIIVRIATEQFAKFLNDLML